MTSPDHGMSPLDPDDPRGAADELDEIDDEIAADARLELDRIERDMALADRPMDDFGLGGLGPSVSADHVGSALDEGPSFDRARTLEDLYAHHSDLDDPDVGKFLRIERKEPPRWQNLPIAGWLEDTSDLYSMGQFAARHGGGVYYVHVMGPQRGYDDEGKPRVKSLEYFRLVIPGEPIIQHGGNDMMRGAAMFPQQQNQQVELRRMDIEEARRKDTERRLREEAQRRSQMDGSLLDKVNEAAERRGAEVRQQMNEDMARLRREVDRLNDLLRQKENELVQSRSDFMTLQADTAQKLREDENQKVRAIREQYDRDKHDLQTRHAEELKRVSSDHYQQMDRRAEEYKRSIAELTERHSRERTEYERRAQEDRQRLVEDHQRRERDTAAERARSDQATQTMYEGRLTEMQRSYESRLNEQQRAHEREANMLKEQRERDVMMVKSTENGATKIQAESHKIQMSALQAELTRAREELSALRRENSELMGKQNRPIMDQIQEAHALARATGGASEEKSWTKDLVGLGKALIDKGTLGDMARGLGGIREQNRARAEQQRQQQSVLSPEQQAAQQQAAQQQAAAAAAAQQQQAAAAAQQQRPGYRTQLPGVPPPPGWGAAEGPPTPDTSHGPEPPSAPVSVSRSQRTQTPMGFVTPDEPPPPAAPDAPGVDNPMAAAPPPEPPPPAPAWSPELVDQFATRLDQAIASDLVSAEVFAAEAIQLAGANNIAIIVSQLDPDKVVDDIGQTEQGAQSHIVTQKGRNYVHAVWAAARAQLGLE